MRNTFIFLLTVSSVVCGPILPLETKSIQAENEALDISRWRDTVVEPAIAGNTDEAEDGSASVALAAALLAQSEHEPAPESGTFAEEGLASAAETGAAPAGTDPLPTVRPKKFYYEELPVGSTPDPNAPDIGPDGKEIPLRPWGEVGPIVPTIWPEIFPTTKATSIEKEVPPSFNLHVATLDNASAVPNTNKANFSFLPGASGTIAEGANAQSTVGSSGAEEAKSGLRQKIVRNGKTRGEGDFPHRELQEECTYAEYEIAPCGFAPYAYASPYQYTAPHQYSAHSQYPESSSGYGRSDYPILAPYAYQRSYLPK